jgi:hypothetical protein
MLQQAYTSGQRRTAQAKHDLALGRQRASQMASDTMQEVEQQPQVEAAPGTVETPSTQPGVSPAPSFGESIDSFERRSSKKKRR